MLILFSAKSWNSKIGFQSKVLLKENNAYLHFANFKYLNTEY